VLSYGVVRVILYLAILVQYQFVTDGRTQGHSIYRARIASSGKNINGLKCYFVYALQTAVVCCAFLRRPATVSPPWSTAVIQDLRLEVGFHDPPPSDNERATVSYIVVHPSFNSTDRSYDIALVRLSSPLDFGDQVRPVCLPRFSGQLFAVQSQCVVTGLAYTPLSGR